MQLSNIPSLNRSVHKTQIWLKELSELGHLDNEQQAYSVLRAVLHKSNVDVVHATDAVFALLSAKITAGEMTNLRELMPADLRLLWPQPTSN